MCFIVCVYMGMSCTCRGQGKTACIFLYHSLPYFLRQGLLLNLGLPDWLEWLATGASRILLFAFLGRRLQSCGTTMALYKCTGNRTQVLTLTQQATWLPELPSQILCFFFSTHFVWDSHDVPEKQSEVRIMKNLVLSFPNLDCDNWWGEGEQLCG